MIQFSIPIKFQSGQLLRLDNSFATFPTFECGCNSWLKLKKIEQRNFTEEKTGLMKTKMKN